MLYIGADHAGFALKEKMKKHLEKRGVAFRDLGAHIFEKKDDYPDYALLVARQVARSKTARGLLVCSTGTGMAIAANRFRGVRAMMCQNARCARLTREHNDANIITFGSLTVTEAEAKRILDTFMNTKTDRAERRLRRIKKLDQISK